MELYSFTVLLVHLLSKSQQQNIGLHLQLVLNEQVLVLLLSFVIKITSVKLVNHVIVVTVPMEELMTKIVVDFQMVHRWFVPKISKIRRLQVDLIQLLLRRILISSMVNSPPI